MPARGVAGRAASRIGQDHHWKLQPLGLVYRHQAHAFGAFLDDRCFVSLAALGIHLELVDKGAERGGTALELARHVDHALDIGEGLLTRRPQRDPGMRQTVNGVYFCRPSVAENPAIERPAAERATATYAPTTAAPAEVATGSQASANPAAATQPNTGSLKPTPSPGAEGERNVLKWVTAIVLLLTTISCLAGYFLYRIGKRQQLDEGVRLHHRDLPTVGAQGVVSLPIVNGQGKVRTGGKVWLAEGPNLPEGAQVIIKSVQGTRITVETADARHTSLAM
jgi:membrane protein implicated in regulation of membrane protease activity